MLSKNLFFLRKYTTIIYKEKMVEVSEFFVEIDKGVYGKICSSPTNKRSVVKKCEWCDDINSTIVNELSALSSLKNIPNVINVEKLEYEVGTWNMVLPRYDFNLKKLCSLNYSEIVYITFQILNGLNSLHNRNIYHCDIKPENILVKVNDRTGKYDIVLADFGLSLFQTDYEKGVSYYEKEVQTLWWRAPEVVTKDTYNTKIDVWSTGIITLSMLIDDEPIKSHNTVDHIFSCRGILKKIPDETPSKLKNLITNMLQFEPEKRLYTHELLNDIIFVGYLPTERVNSNMKRITIMDRYTSFNFNTWCITDESRKELINYISYTHKKLGLSRGSLFLSIKILDIILNKLYITEEYLKLYTIGCIYVSALVHKNTKEDHFEIEDFKFLTKPEGYELKDLNQTVVNIIKLLNYNIYIPTELDYIYAISLENNIIKDDEEYIIYKTCKMLRKDKNVRNISSFELVNNIIKEKFNINTTIKHE